MLTIIQVGNNPASNTYIRNKVRAVMEAGMDAQLVSMDETATTQDIIDQIQRADACELCKAIIVQLPLPKHVEKAAVLRSIPPEKDIDGLNPVSQYDPLTPCAIMRWLRERGVDLVGKNVTILGRSELVGKPLALMMIDAGATVTVCNSHTPGLRKDQLCINSDIVVSAVGKRGAVDWGCVNLLGNQLFVDVGINRDTNGKLCGDITPAAQHAMKEVDSEYTPVPGGVGRWTVLELVLRLAEMEGVNKSAD
jgi:methylenetetrahydrofolate dehydrogenase (NADP+)/methenyltetrahydrofolate cyclohydrolase